MLATPLYKIRKDQKAGVLIDPKDVPVVGPMQEQVETLNVENVSSV